MAGIRRSRQTWLVRVVGGATTAEQLREAAHALRQLLADGPKRARELTAEFEALGFPRPALRWAGLWVDVVRIPPSGT